MRDEVATFDVHHLNILMESCGVQQRSAHCTSIWRLTMLFATALLSLKLVGSPERNCNAPAQTGIFRITALTKDSSSAKIGMILLENVANCLEASILIQDNG